MRTAVDDLGLLMAVVPDATPEEQAAFLELPESSRNVTLGLVARCARSSLEAEVALREKVTKALGYLFSAVLAEADLRNVIARHFADDDDLAQRLDAHTTQLNWDTWWHLLAENGLTETLWFVETED